MRVGKYYIGGKFDLWCDAFTYAMRIEVGECFGNAELSEYERMKAAFRVMYGYSPRLLPIKRRVRLLTALMQDFARMVESEQDALKYEPTEQEKAAGIDAYAEAVGHFGTVKSIAKAFGRDPDEILQWPWQKVFGVLLTDLADYKFNERLRKEYGRNNK